MQSIGKLTEPQTEQVEPVHAGSSFDRIMGSRYVSVSAFLFAALQALCPAVIAFSAARSLIAVGALAFAVGTNTPSRGWHADWIRIPMMTLAAVGATLNLFVIWHLRRLRTRPAAQWRIGRVPSGTLRNERLQVVLAVLTYICLTAEWITHPIMHHPHH